MRRPAGGPEAARTARGLLLLVGVAVALACAWRGGFPTAVAPWLVAVTGAAAWLAALSGAPAGAWALRAPVTWSLLGLGGLAVLSAAWTVGAPQDALRWGLVAFSLAALLVASSALVQQVGPVPVAGILLAVAFLAGATGLAAVALRSGPLAERVGGAWRPGGPFEYSPALALVQVMALPVALAAAVGGSSRRRFAGAAAAAMAMAILGLAGSRLMLAAGLAVLAVAVLCAPRLLHAGSAPVALLAAISLAAAAVVSLVCGGYVSPDDAEPRAWLLLGCAAPPVVAGVVWSRVPPGGLGIARRFRVPLLVSVAVATVLIVAVPTVVGLQGRGIEPRGGVLHGRERQWNAALVALGRRPVGGSGAQTYLIATVRDQQGSPQRYAHSLPLEVGAELGAPGLLLVLGALIGSLLLVWRARRVPAAWLFAPGVLAWCAANLVDFTWHFAGLGALWALCLGALVALGGDPRSDGSVTLVR